jgi:hypothetical protein
VTLIEYRSALNSLLSIDARRAVFTGPYADYCRRHFSLAPDPTCSTPSWCETGPQTERVTDSAICSLQTQRRTP